MTLRQLSYFVAVVEEGSITRAAKRLHVAQPSLSQQLRELERFLGGELIERLPRATRLTSLGRQFEPHAREVLMAAQRAERVVREALTQPSGELEIATVRSIAVGILPSSITRWRAAHPDSTVRLFEFGHRDVLEDRVRSGLADLAIGPRPREWAGPLESLGWEEFVVVLPTADAAAVDGASIALEELRDRDWVLFEPSHGLSDVAGFACGAAGFVPRAAVQTAQVDAAVRLAAAGLGPALIPRDAVPIDLEAHVRSLDPPLARELAAYARKEFTPMATAYLELLREDGCWAGAPPGVVAVP
ncbi:MAG TPA: LysR family transcriptional regulator [Solirubrobacteraceae bacterium]